jgi:hypothetical protein
VVSVMNPYGRNLGFLDRNSSTLKKETLSCVESLKDVYHTGRCHRPEDSALWGPEASEQ